LAVRPHNDYTDIRVIVFSVYPKQR